jgi:uncharacterized protein YjbJ (UPF0337 family)
MSWDRIEGKWKQGRGKAMHQWGKIMNDELAAISGKYEELVGKLQEKYGIAKDDANRQVHEFKRTVELLKKSNNKLIAAQKALSNQKHVNRRPANSKTPRGKRVTTKAHG